jgi:demethylmenaquinone methyltransferase/2-methoxy-6-polyprenyl-1,4-benzoquinol methylase
MNTDYDFIAKLYDPLLYFPLKSIRLTVLKELAGCKNKKILDLCCGTGNQLKILSENGFTDLHGLDISEAMLKVAKKNNLPIKIYTEDAAKTSFKDESIDIIIISFAIHEKERKTQENIIKEAYRLIKKKGFILVADYDFNDKTRKLVKTGIRIIEWIAGKEHYTNFRSYIKNNGLSSLITHDDFKLTTQKKRLMNGVAISILRK